MSMRSGDNNKLAVLIDADNAQPSIATQLFEEEERVVGNGTHKDIFIRDKQGDVA